MSDTLTVGVRKPTVVVVVAILQFLSAATFFLISLFSILGLIFGASWNMDQMVGKMMTQYTTDPNMSFGVTVFFGALLVICLITAILFLLLGIGLLKGSKVSWYLQIALSILGLLAFPLGTIINGVVLYFFFRRDIRDFYRT
jgi:hypothetical protein